MNRYRKEKIPVRYLQLDSWWYDKSYPGMSSSDHTGSWKSYGGIMRYRADATLFPQGLGAFDKSIGGLPLVVHSRWISQQSPYHKNFKISGIAPVGANWWNDTAQYLKQNGVITYEQDWNSRITQQTPAFSSTIHTGDDFYNNMANSCQTHHLTMQYCMALPSDFLEGSRYSNLTTIRSSDDRFSRPRWRNFIYTSQLAYAIGSWPWVDVFFSRETNNMIVDALSAGPVGTGDALGAEDKENIMMAVRGDGVIVKPDVPLMPLDRMYIEDAERVAPAGVAFERPSRGATPFIASTWTGDGAIRTAYGPRETGYYIVAPKGPSGIALFGDKGEFASMGKERIASLKEDPHSVTAQVLFADGDKSVTLFGDAASAPSVVVHGGTAGQVTYHQNDGSFYVRVTPDSSTPAAQVNGEPVRRVSVEFTLPAK
jgi:hypothetical protein